MRNLLWRIQNRFRVFPSHRWVRQISSRSRSPSSSRRRGRWSRRPWSLLWARLLSSASSPWSLRSSSSSLLMMWAEILRWNLPQQREPPRPTRLSCFDPSFDGGTHAFASKPAPDNSLDVAPSKKKMIWKGFKGFRRITLTKFFTPGPARASTTCAQCRVEFIGSFW